MTNYSKELMFADNTILLIIGNENVGDLEIDISFYNHKIWQFNIVIEICSQDCLS